MIPWKNAAHGEGTDAELLTLARLKRASGSLPPRAPRPVRRSLGRGCTCAVCGAPIGPEEPQIEADLPEDRESARWIGSGPLVFHLRCHGAWEAVGDAIEGARCAP